MTSNQSLCISVSDTNKCPNCNSSATIKNGRTKNKKQQLVCKQCGKRFIEYYSYKAYLPRTNESIIHLTKEGLGIRSTARLLKISATTLMKRIIKIASYCRPPEMNTGKVYELDEMKSFVKRKKTQIWIVYALDRESKKVVSFNIGSRTSATIKTVVNNIVTLRPASIYTDKLNIYKGLINQNIHKTNRYGTNRIERNNLSIRTHIKRLNRKTICFSRSSVMLSAVLRIYFWS